MNTHLCLSSIILLCIFPIILSITCPSSQCSDSGPVIRSPFQLPQPSPNHSGFDLSCNAKALTVLKLPNSGDFYVRNIDYSHQQITLYDPQNCTPNRLMNLNLSNSPFNINYYYRNYTFLTCPTDLVASRYPTIHCLSNSTTSTLATTSLSLAQSMPNSCTIITTVPIPISWPYLYDQNNFTSDLNQDFRLGWNISGCIPCESAGGFCQVNLSALHDQQPRCITNCQTDINSERPQRAFSVFKLVVLFVTIPAVTFTMTVTMYFWFLDQRRRHRDWEQTGNTITMHSNASTPVGLDEVTIESYAKIVVGESKRIPGRNDIACPICLTEYCPKDTLRSIPECHHCFNAECVDEWLRSNATCPVCRNSPSHS